MHHTLFLMVNGELMRQQLPKASRAPCSLPLPVPAAELGMGQDAEQPPGLGSRADLHPNGSALQPCYFTQMGFSIWCSPFQGENELEQGGKGRIP